MSFLGINDGIKGNSLVGKIGMGVLKNNPYTGLYARAAEGGERLLKKDKGEAGEPVAVDPTAGASPAAVSAEAPVDPGASQVDGDLNPYQRQATAAPAAGLDQSMMNWRMRQSAYQLPPR